MIRSATVTDTAALVELWRPAGYRRDELGFMEKWLVPKPSGLFPPNGL
jgi:hypothetical protein